MKGYNKTDIDILVGACVYAASRKLHVPILLADVAMAINCKEHTLFGVSTKLQSTMKLELPALDLQELLLKSIGILKNAGVAMEGHSKTSAFMKGLKRRSISLLKFCESKFLTTGKKPLPVVAAIIFKCLKCTRREDYTEDLEDLTLDQVGEALSCSSNTAEYRVKDIQSCLDDLKSELVEKPLSTLPLLPDLECSGKQGRRVVVWEDTTEIPDAYVLEWVANLQKTGQKDAQAASELLGTPTRKRKAGEACR